MGPVLALLLALGPSQLRPTVRQAATPQEGARVDDPVSVVYTNRMAKAAVSTVRRSPGRPTRLTDEVREAILSMLRKGAPVRLACQHAGIGVSTFMEWLARADADHNGRQKSPLYAEFARSVEKATAEGHLALVNAVYTVSIGEKCIACSDGTTYGKDSLLMCPACKGSRYSMRPNGKLALDTLERRLPKEYGKQLQIAAQVEISGTVELEVADLVQGLETLSAEQLIALAFDEPKQIEEAVTVVVEEAEAVE